MYSPDQASQVLLAQHDDVVEKLAANRSHEPFPRTVPLSRALSPPTSRCARSAYCAKTPPKQIRFEIERLIVRGSRRHSPFRHPEVELACSPDAAPDSIPPVPDDRMGHPTAGGGD